MYLRLPFELFHTTITCADSMALLRCIFLGNARLRPCRIQLGPAVGCPDRRSAPKAGVNADNASAPVQGCLASLAPHPLQFHPALCQDALRPAPADAGPLRARGESTTRRAHLLLTTEWKWNRVHRRVIGDCQ